MLYITFFVYLYIFYDHYYYYFPFLFLFSILVSSFYLNPQVLPCFFFFFSHSLPSLPHLTEKQRGVSEGLYGV